MRYQTPFSHENTGLIYKDWLDIIRFHETGSVLGLPKRDQLYRVNQFIEQHAFPILLFDPSAERIENPEELNDFIEKKVHKNRSSHVLLILDADVLLFEKPHLLSSMSSMYYQKKFSSVIFFFQKNILLPRYLRLFAKHSILYKNTTVFPLYEKKICSSLPLLCTRLLSNKSPTP